MEDFILEKLRDERARCIARPFSFPEILEMCRERATRTIDDRRGSVSPRRSYYKMCELFLAGRKNIARSPHAPVLLPVRRVRLLRELHVRKARSFRSWNQRSRHRADAIGYFHESSSGGSHACES